MLKHIFPWFENNKHVSQIRDRGNDYQTVQSVQCYWNAVNSASITPINYNARYPVSHFIASVNDLFEHALQNLSDSDMGIKIQNRLNHNDKPIGISLRCKDQLAGDVIWSVFEKVTQSISRFNAMDRLIVTYIPLGCLSFRQVCNSEQGQTTLSWHKLKEVSCR